jgi:hypothetical protein
MFRRIVEGYVEQQIGAVKCLAAVFLQLGLQVQVYPKEGSMRQQFVPRLVATVVVATVVMWMSAIALPSAQRSDTQGLKETESFIKTGTETSSAVGKARLQIQTTLASYNGLVSQPSSDMKNDFKKLLSGTKDMDAKVDDARARVAKMETAGNTYFAGRAANNKQIQDVALLQTAQQRLDENQRQYATMLVSLREAGQSLQELRIDLDNQITFLGSDLTPGAAASIKPQAQTLNERGLLALGKVDQAIAAANKYFDSIRPTKS